MKRFIALLCGLAAMAMPAVAFADVAPIRGGGGGGGWAVFGFAVFIIAVVVLAVVLVKRKKK